MGPVLKRCVKLLSAPAALAQTTIASVAFGIVTYLYDGNGWTALVYTLSCFLLLQVGYFAGIVYMVWAEHKDRSK